MADRSPLPIGSVGWVDLTMDDAGRVRDFYGAVVGWRPSDVDMGGYADFNMTRPADGVPAAGVCHRRGSNADLPPVWLVYFVVADLEASIARCLELGGSTVSGPKGTPGKDRYCVVRDPAGAVAALWQRGTAA